MLPKRILLLLTIFTLSASLYSQTQPIEQNDKDQDTNDFDPKKWTDRIVVGGNMGAQFGNSTYIEVSPIVGYRITSKLTSGVGFTYEYFKLNYDDPMILDYNGSVIGGKIYSQYSLVFGFFAHAEYEYDWYKFEYEDASYGTYQGNVPAFLVGGGYNYNISDNVRFQLMVLYDLMYDQNRSIYSSPWVFRMGINVGL